MPSQECTLRQTPIKMPPSTFPPSSQVLCFHTIYQETARLSVCARQVRRGSRLWNFGRYVGSPVAILKVSQSITSPVSPPTWEGKAPNHLNVLPFRLTGPFEREIVFIKGLRGQMIVFNLLVTFTFV